MATFTKEFLSGSTNGAPLSIAATASPGTTIHTAHATAKDEIHIYVTNGDTASRELTVEFGGTAAKDQIIRSIPKKSGLILVIPGFVLSGSLVVKAFADAANVLYVTGWVNRITP